MSEGLTRFDPIEFLENKEELRLYLEGCVDEDPGDGSVIRVALRHIARSKNMTDLAREIGMTRGGLYKALSEDGNPSFAAVLGITRALGLKVRITA